MKKLFTVFLLSHLYLIATAQEVIPFQLTPNGHMIVKVKLNNTHEGYFIFDTGAGGHVIGSKFLEKVKNDARYMGMGTGFRHNGDRVDIAGYYIQSISMGALEQKNPLVGYFPLLDQYGVDGLISAKLYEHRPITIDYVKKEIRIENDKSLKRIEKSAASVPLYFHQMTDRFLDLFIELKINDQYTCQAEFDTGSGFAKPVLNPFYLDLLQIEPTSAEVRTHEVQDLTPGKNTSYDTKIASLSLSGSEKLRMEMADVSFKEKLIYDGLVSSLLFKDKVITIDIPGKKLWVH